ATERSVFDPSPRAFPTRRSSDLLQQPADASDASRGDAHAPILRQGDRGDPDDAGPGDLLRSVPAGARGDDEDFIAAVGQVVEDPDRTSTRLNSSHVSISYAVFCL